MRKDIMSRAKKITAKRKQREAGKKNLQKYLESSPAPPALKHGAYSQVIRHRYTDNRFKEAKQLKTITQDLIQDLGGEANVSAAQRLLLENVRSKLIVLLQIGAYIGQQESIIDAEGNLLPCLAHGYTTYAESLRRDLEALFAVKRKPDSMSYEKAMKALQRGTA